VHPFQTSTPTLTLFPSKAGGHPYPRTRLGSYNPFSTEYIVSQKGTYLSAIQYTNPPTMRFVL